MAIEQIEIGNTGNQLVSAINSNFSYITGKVYNLLDYGCVGNGSTDNTTAFNSILTTIGSNYATIEIPGGRFFIGTTTIPENVELNFINGGRLVLKSSATIIIHGHISAGHRYIFENQSEVVENLPSLSIHRQEWISPIWFGGKMDGLDASKTINYNAFRSAWNAVGRLSQTQMGGMIKFPAGTFIMKGFENLADGFDYEAKYSDIAGAGKTKTTLMLANNENKPLWKTYDNFDFNFRDIGFNGNADNNTSMTDALIDIDYYRINFENIYITNCKANGIYINRGQTNAINFHNVSIGLCGATAIIIEDCLNFSFSGMIDIESCDAIIDIKQTGVTFNDSRYSMRGIINASIYAENCESGIRLYGVAGINLKLLMYARDTQAFVHLIYDTTEILGVPRNMPCTNNYIDITQSRDDKADGSYGRVDIDNLCYDNDIVTILGALVIDNDGRNKITSRLGKGVNQRGKTGDLSGACYFDNTNPALAPYYYSDVTFPAKSIFPDTLSWVEGLMSIACARVTSGILQWRLLAEVLPPNANVYFHFICKGSPGLNVVISFYCQDLLEEYDYSRKRWLATSEGFLNTRRAYIELNGDLQHFSIPCYVPATEAAERIWIQMIAVKYSTSPASDNIEVYYANLSNNKDQDIIHQLAGDVIGYYDDSIIDSANLPPAASMRIGTKNFCPDLGLEVISDGTDWCKPDGTTL